MTTKLNFKNIALTITISVAVSFLYVTGESANAQNNVPVIKPDVHISVKKETDKNGNIIKYDSTYISTWSGNGDESFKNADSSEKNFPAWKQPFFKDNEIDFFDSTFNFSSNFFGNDSLFFDSIYGSHIFGFYDNAMKEMEEMIRCQNDIMHHLFEKRHNFNDLPEINTSEDSGSIKQNALPRNEDYINKPEL